MLKIEVKKVEENKDDWMNFSVDLAVEDKSTTTEVIGALAVACAAVLTELKSSFNLSVEDSVKEFAELVIGVLNKEGEENGK